MSQDQRGGLVGVGREERVWRGVRSPRERVIRVWRVGVVCQRIDGWSVGSDTGRGERSGGERFGGGPIRADVHHLERRCADGLVVGAQDRGRVHVPEGGWRVCVGSGQAERRASGREGGASERSCGEATDVQLCEAPQGTYFVRRGGAAAAAWLRERKRRDTAARSMCASAEAQGGEE